MVNKKTIQHCRNNWKIQKIQKLSKRQYWYQ